jgi:hypothetical protein
MLLIDIALKILSEIYKKNRTFCHEFKHVAIFA